MTNKKKETFPSRPAPLGMGKPLGDLFTGAELKQLTRLARKRGVTETVLVHDLVIKFLDKNVE